MAELDAAYLHLYGLDADDAEYVLSTFKGIHQPADLYPGRASTSTAVLEQFNVLAMRSSS